MTNSEKYKTAEEREHEFVKFCKKKGGCGYCELINRSPCSFSWLELEAEEEKPLPCPFCGGKTLMNCGHLIESVEHHWVDCVNPECMYRSANHTNKQEAISEHNRVAKAAMSAKESEVK